MKASALPVALLMAAATLLTSCVTHRFFINLRDNGSVQYAVEGDSVDVMDGLIKLPSDDAWIQTSHERTEGVDEEPSLRLSYQAKDDGRINHPVGPPENPGTLTIRRMGSPLHKSLVLQARFPSWEVGERYGDPEKYLPEELVGSFDDPELDSLPPEKRKEYEAAYWKAQVLAANDRYRRMLDDIVLSELTRRGKEPDEDHYDEASKKFEGTIHGLVERAIAQGEDNADLDWYVDLRMPMAETAMALLGGVTADWLPVADSLEQRYQSWLDLSDESVVLELLMPGRVKTAPPPDTLKGDTLSWEFTGETLSDSTFVITASSWEPRWPGVIFLMFLIEIVAALLLHRRYHHER
ncbi:MAG: hypothetical protein V2A56_13520 [bacterium]